MRRVSTSRAFVAGVVILSMLLSMSVLFGAQGPVAKVTSPSAKAKVQGVIEITAEVFSAGVDYVILVVDNDRPGSTNSTPCAFSLDTRELSDGPHKVSVEAYSGFGLIGASKPITIYVKNGSGLRIAAKPAARTQPARTQVAAKPAPAKLVTAAQAGGKSSAKAGTIIVQPLTPARSVAAGTPPGSPVTVAAAEGGRASAVASPTVVGRGPAPEPTRTVAARTALPRSVGVAEAGSYAAAVSAPSAARPPVVQLTKDSVPAHRTHTVMLDGQAVEFDVVPVVRDGRIHGGFRALFGRVGGHVTWLSKTRTARSVSNSLTVEVPTGSRIAKVNGQDMDMGAKAEVHNGRTIVPVRFFAGVTGSTMAWDSKTGIAHVRTPSRSLAQSNN